MAYRKKKHGGIVVTIEDSQTAEELVGVTKRWETEETKEVAVISVRNSRRGRGGNSIACLAPLGGVLRHPQLALPRDALVVLAHRHIGHVPSQYGPQGSQEGRGWTRAPICRTPADKCVAIQREAGAGCAASLLPSSSAMAKAQCKHENFLRCFSLRQKMGNKRDSPGR